MSALELAKRFHECYERLAPQHGYATRASTREFNPESTNGRTMVAVCAELLAASPNLGGEAGEREVFEAWDREIYALPDYCYAEYKGGFSNLTVESRWQAWQAHAALSRTGEAAQTAAAPVEGVLRMALYGVNGFRNCIRLSSLPDDVTEIVLNVFDQVMAENGVTDDATPIRSLSPSTDPTPAEGKKL